MLTGKFLDNGLLSVSEGTFVEIHCFGAGDLIWESSSGAAIIETNALNPPFNLYQSHDPTNKFQNLVIISYSLADTAIYTCTKVGVVWQGRPVSEPVYITSCKCSHQYST